jgi:hypothetical protein
MAACIPLRTPTALLAATICILLLTVFQHAMAADPTRPIILRETGGFPIGGKRIANPKNASETMSCDHGYVEYFVPWKPRRTSLMMVHSSSTQVWQNRWDGGPGFKDMFLRRGYPVYLWDGPRVGRANLACEQYEYAPDYTDEYKFEAWNFGLTWKNWWNNVQFPKENSAAWDRAVRSRYFEFDTLESIHLQSESMANATDSGLLGDNIVYLTNTAAGLRAQLAVVKSKRQNVQAIYAYEGVGYVFPDNVGIEPGTKGWGPIIVSVEEFKKLASLTAIQFVWGDHRNTTEKGVRSIEFSLRAAELINQYGGNAQVLMLGDDAGLWGSTHIPMADMDNDKVADLLDEFLADNKLDMYSSDGSGEH